jgi:hypothetical protein
LCGFFGGFLLHSIPDKSLVPGELAHPCFLRLSAGAETSVNPFSICTPSAPGFFFLFFCFLQPLGFSPFSNACTMSPTWSSENVAWCTGSSPIARYASRLDVRLMKSNTNVPSRNRTF